jgi:hypothetical protein
VLCQINIVSSVLPEHHQMSLHPNDREPLSRQTLSFCPFLARNDHHLVGHHMSEDTLPALAKLYLWNL